MGLIVRMFPPYPHPFGGVTLNKSLRPSGHYNPSIQATKEFLKARSGEAFALLRYVTKAEFKNEKRKLGPSAQFFANKDYDPKKKESPTTAAPAKGGKGASFATSVKGAFAKASNALFSSDAEQPSYPMVLCHRRGGDYRKNPYDYC